MTDLDTLFDPNADWTPGNDITVRVERRGRPDVRKLETPPEQMTPYEILRTYAELRDEFSYYSEIAALYQHLFQSLEPFIEQLLAAHGKEIPVEIGIHRHYLRATSSRGVSVTDRPTMLKAIKALPGWADLVKEDYNHASLMKRLRDELKDAGTSLADASDEDILTILPPSVVAAIELKRSEGMEFKAETKGEFDKRKGRA